MFQQQIIAEQVPHRGRVRVIGQGIAIALVALSVVPAHPQTATAGGIVEMQGIKDLLDRFQPEGTRIFWVPSPVSCFARA